MDRHKEEDTVRKLMNKPKVKQALEEAYLDSLLGMPYEIDVDEVLSDE